MYIDCQEQGRTSCRRQYPPSRSACHVQLDHFRHRPAATGGDDENDNTFQQRYFLCSEYWGPASGASGSDGEGRSVSRRGSGAASVGKAGRGGERAAPDALGPIFFYVSPPSFCCRLQEPVPYSERGIMCELGKSVWSSSSLDCLSLALRKRIYPHRPHRSHHICDQAVTHLTSSNRLPKSSSSQAGNEADVSLYVGASGLMWENAPDFKALLVFAEHRFYGESLPFGAPDKRREFLRQDRYLVHSIPLCILCSGRQLESCRK